MDALTTPYTDGTGERHEDFCQVTDAAAQALKRKIQNTIQEE